MTTEDEELGGRLEVRDCTGAVPEADVAWLAAAGERALHTLRAAGEVRVVILDDARMADAHERFCGVPGPTDVLTFDERNTEPIGDGLDADLLICFDEAQRQGSVRGHHAREELLLYIVHGILHCLGHDDHDEAARAAMHAREDAILTSLGIGPVYSREPRT